MYKDIFTQLGLSSNEATVYEFLLKNGESSAGQIIKKTPLKRGVIYNTLSNLLKKGIASQKIKNKISYFKPEHPEKLREFAEQKENEFKKAKNTLEANLPTFISEFNLVSGKPGVRYFEGIDGIKKVINNTLTSKTVIYTYADMEKINQYIKKINDEYSKKRNELKIEKKVLLVDSEYTHKFLKNYPAENLDIRFIKNIRHFTAVMQIYDNKISYITLAKERITGIIIDDKNIYEMHKILFENDWKNAQI